MSKRISSLRLLGLALIVSLGFSGKSHAGLLDGFGAMGDSGTAGNTTTVSWVPVLEQLRGFNFGPGRAYNVAQGGATTSSVLSSGQHTELASLVNDGDVTFGALLIGTNDFGASGTGALIAAGLLTGQPLQDWLDQRANNIITATDTVLSAGPEGFLLFGVADVTLLPGGRSLITTPEQKQRVGDAVDEINRQIREYAETSGIAYFDTAAAMRDLLGGTTASLGGVSINLTTGNSDPHHFFRDQIHPNVLGNGVIANMVIASLNEAYGAGIAPLSDYELLEMAGLENEYVEETLSTVDLSPYIVVPEPASALLLLLAVPAFTAAARRSRRRRCRSTQ